MKTILVPIDYAQNSHNIIAYALDIAAKAGADIILLHVFYPVMSPPASYNATDVILAMETAKAKELEAFAEKAKLSFLLNNKATHEQAAAYHSIGIKGVASMGGPFEKIMAAITKYKIDLVVMGMQEGEAISQALLGSTTISVMLAGKVPVLAVPKGAEFKPFTSVVFAANLSKMPAPESLRMLRDFILTAGAKLDVLHLHQSKEQQDSFDAQQALEVLAANLQDIDYTIAFDLQQNVAAGIQQFIQQKQADLLVLIPQKHSILERLRDKSITGRITAHPLVPLLALPSSFSQQPETTKEKQTITG